MAITTQDLVYVDILARIVNQIQTSTLNAAHIYIAHQPTFNPTWTQAIQLVPPVPVAQHPVSGAGLVLDDFEIAYWSRNLLDQEGRDTIRISDATYGIISSLMTDTRAALIQYWGSVLTIACTFLRGSTIQGSDEYPGWVFCTDTFRCGYEIVATLEATP